MTQHVNVMICTPGNSVMTAYNKSLLRTVEELGRRGITWGWSQEFSSHVADARETTLNGDRENNPFEVRPFKGNLTYDKLFWIDSDIAWNPEDFIKLYESDKDIVSGAYLLSTGEVVAYKELLRGAYVIDEVLEMKEPIQIQGCGFGFIAVKQGVFESLTRPWFQSTMATYTDSDGKEFEFMVMGEDLSWCKRVRDKGYEIWLDPTVRVLHHKMMRLSWEGIQPCL